MADIIVVGAGISGLATAWFLRKHGHQVVVLESGPEPGGAIRTRREAGFLIEAGPNSTLERGKALPALIRSLRLETELVEANPVAKRRYIVKNNQLVALPGGALAFLRTPVFSASGKLRLLLEPFKGRATEEESVAQFVRRRLGKEFLDWAIDPFISGVYAGDPERLSARAATAKVYALEAEYRSLVVGALMRLLKRQPSGPEPTGRLISFREGMQTLARAVAQDLGEALHTGHAVSTVLPESGERWRVVANGSEYVGDHVVLSLPAFHSAELLRPLHRELSETLARITYAPVASVALGFDRAQVAHPLDGFGVLIPKRMGVQTLGVLFSSTLFPQRAPEGKILLTAFIGGARNPSVTRQGADWIVERVLNDLRPLLGIRDMPALRRVHLWPKAIPQYELGHLDRIRSIDRAIAALPGLHFRANWRDGISVADCVTNAMVLAERLEPAADLEASGL
jgi:oxygen-dependent protoporphyrinogen oxidase